MPKSSFMHFMYKEIAKMNLKFVYIKKKMYLCKLMCVPARLREGRDT